MAKTIRANQLTPGNTYLVSGKIAFSRLARQTTDEERAKDNERRRQASQKAIMIDRNYTTATIYDATVECADPQNPTLEERYAYEGFYISKSKKNYTGSCFSAMNKGEYLPRIYVRNPQTNTYDEVTLEKELANDLQVTLVMKVFPGQNGNNGVSLESVLVTDPQGIKYYESNGEVANALASRGIILNNSGNGARKASQGIPASTTDASQNDAPMAEDIDSVAAPSVSAPTNAFSSTPIPNSGNAFSSTPAGNPFQSAPANNNPFQGTPAQSNGFGPGRQY